MDFGFRIRYFFVIFLIFMPALIWGKVNVIVSIIPQKTFVEKIAGNLADVSVMVVPGASPATYEPKPSQMRKIAKAQIYFSIGVPFEKAWIPRFKAQNRNMRIIDITDGIKKLPMQGHHHHHDETEHHRISSSDPHVWLSPALVRILARNIAKALEEIDPGNAAKYRKNLKRFEKEINRLDRELKKILKPCRNRVMMVFHPSWGYFARDYGLKQISIEIEGKEPKSRKLQELIQKVKKERVKTLFVQPQFSKRTAKAVAASLGAEIVVADPLAPDWSENLIRIANRVCEAAR